MFKTHSKPPLATSCLLSETVRVLKDPNHYTLNVTFQVGGRTFDSRKCLFVCWFSFHIIDIAWPQPASYYPFSKISLFPQSFLIFLSFSSPHFPSNFLEFLHHIGLPDGGTTHPGKPGYATELQYLLLKLHSNLYL